MKRHNVLSYIFLIAMSIVFAFPFYFLLVSTTNTSLDVTNGSLFFGGHFVENLTHLFSQTDMLRAIINSSIIAIIQTSLALVIGSAAGYGFEMYQSRWSEWIFKLILLSMMIPFAAMMIPLFRLFGSLSNVSEWIGIDSYASIYLPYLATAFLIFYFRQNTKMFPRELIEAGKMDGLSDLGCFVRIYMPTMRTTYAAAAIITFMNSWNNYLWPLIVVQTPEKQTIPLLISNLSSSYSPDFGMIMMAVFIATLPTLIIFFVLQKQFVAGMLGASK